MRISDADPRTLRVAHVLDTAAAHLDRTLPHEDPAGVASARRRSHRITLTALTGLLHTLSERSGPRPVHLEDLFDAEFGLPAPAVLNAAFSALSTLVPVLENTPDPHLRALASALWDALPVLDPHLGVHSALLAHTLRHEWLGTTRPLGLPADIIDLRSPDPDSVSERDWFWLAPQAPYPLSPTLVVTRRCHEVTSHALLRLAGSVLAESDGAVLIALEVFPAALAATLDASSSDSNAHLYFLTSPETLPAPFSAHARLTLDLTRSPELSFADALALAADAVAPPASPSRSRRSGPLPSLTSPCSL